jgi:hypothetical protein
VLLEEQRYDRILEGGEGMVDRGNILGLEGGVSVGV